MVDVFALVVPAVMIGFVALFVAVLRHEGKRRAALSAAIADTGLTVTKPMTAWAPRLEGALGSRKARIWHMKQGKNGPWTTHVEVAHAGPRDFRLRLDPEGFATSLAKAFGGEDLHVDDPEFDAAFRVRTSDLMRATFVLDAGARRALVAEPPRRLEGKRGVFEVVLTDRVEDAPALVAWARRLAAMGERLEATA